VQGRELLQEELEQARIREAAALQREKEAARREAEALKGLIAVEERMEAVVDRERTARELAAEVRRASAIVEALKSTLADLAAAVAKREEGLAAREAKEVARLQELQKREEAVEDELAARTRRLQECEAALREREAKVEELLAERSASTDRITRWVGAVNPLLESLGANPIWVSGAPSPLGTVAEPPELHRLKYASPLSRAPTYFKQCNPLGCRVSARYNHGSTGSMQVFPRTKASLQLQHNSSPLIYKHVNIITSHVQLQPNLYKRCLNGQARRLVYIHSGKETNT
jgi:hypothetical protein